MTATDPFTEAARAEAEAVMSEARERVGITVQEQNRYVEGHVAGAEWARTHLTTQEESVLMTSREETISDRLSDAGYTEYAEDEDGGLTGVSAPLGEVLRIVSAAHQPIEDASARAVRSWRAMYQVAEEERDQALAALESDPSDAEVEAACLGFYNDPNSLTDWTKLARVEPDLADKYRAGMRRALSAARAARRDEEKRDD